MNEEKKKKFYQKWWFWVVVIFLLIIIANPNSFKDGLQNSIQNNTINNTQTDNSSANTENLLSNTTQDTTTQSEKQIFTFESEEVGEYGKMIVLNQNTDFPTPKYLYKLPSGTYKVTSTTNNTIGVSVVKDELTREDGDYPEALNYVGEQSVISGNPQKIGTANIKESATITIGSDESVSLVGKGTISFEKQ